jgi:hypothetical protein
MDRLSKKGKSDKGKGGSKKAKGIREPVGYRDSDWRGMLAKKTS